MSANLIERALYERLSAHFKQKWQESRQKTKELQARSDSGPSYYTIRRHRLGPSLLKLVERSLSDGLITYTKAGHVLGVKPRNIDPLLRLAR